MGGLLYIKAPGPRTCVQQDKDERGIRPHIVLYLRSTRSLTELNTGALMLSLYHLHLVSSIALPHKTYLIHSSFSILQVSLLSRMS